MPKLNIETIKQKVFVNSLNTCEYVSGYENTNSIIRVKCVKHNLEFETKYENVRRDNRAHHICPKCQEEDKLAKRLETGIEVECAYCGKKFIKPNSKLDNSKSGLYFCCREHKDLAQSLKSGDKFAKMRPEHYGKILSRNSNYRDFAFREHGAKCAICGFDEDIDMLEVHHIDENRDNNTAENLIPLCPMCHRKLTTHKYKLINREKIIKIEE